MTVGWRSAWGASRWKACQLKRDKASGILLSEPAMCWAVKKKLCVAAFIRSARSRCITSGAVEVREFKIYTTDSLSQRKSTTCLNHEGPQMWAETTMGKSSLNSKEEVWSTDGHLPYSQCEPKIAPNPREPEASLDISRLIGGERPG